MVIIAQCGSSEVFDTVVIFALVPFSNQPHVGSSGESKNRSFLPTMSIYELSQYQVSGFY